MIEIRKISQKGRGVVAQRLIEAGALIESSPASAFFSEQWDSIKKTDIFKYCFVRPSEYKEKQNFNGYIVFGLVSFCNHSETPNVYIEWSNDEVGLWTHLIALTDIKPGEELLSRYTNIDEYSLASEFV